MGDVSSLTFDKSAGSPVGSQTESERNLEQPHLHDKASKPESARWLPLTRSQGISCPSLQRRPSRPTWICYEPLPCFAFLYPTWSERWGLKPGAAWDGLASSCSSFIQASC